MSTESLMRASTANGSIDKSVREMQSTSMVNGTSSDTGSASATWTVEIGGHVVSGFQSCVSHLKHVKTACELPQSVGPVW